VAIAGWLVDKSAAARADDPRISTALEQLAGSLHVCAVGELEQLYSARSAREYDDLKAALRGGFPTVEAPSDLLRRALKLQHDLAHHHGMWHRISIPDLLIAETALHHGLGVLHVDGDFERIAAVRPLVTRRLP
jgi:predicted nucleic acid-binding protein